MQSAANSLIIQAPRLFQEAARRRVVSPVAARAASDLAVPDSVVLSEVAHLELGRPSADVQLAVLGLVPPLA